MILETISRLSQELNLKFDSVGPTVHIQSSSQKVLQHSSQRKPAAAKIEAWKMWQNDGLSFGEIAVSLLLFLFFNIIIHSCLCKNLEDFLFSKTYGRGVVGKIK